MTSSSLSQDDQQPTTHNRVLVADADANTLALYRQAFADQGCDLIEAMDGRDALTKALVRTPSLVMTELGLPLMDGFALCQILRRDRATAHVPIIVVTTAARAAQSARLEAVGVDTVIVKPTTAAEIRDRAHAAIAKAGELRNRSAAILKGRPVALSGGGS